MPWSPGDVVVRRDRLRHATWHAVAAVVVEDSDRAFVSYIPPGAETMRHDVDGVELVERLATGQWTLQSKARYNHTLAIHRPGDAFSVLVFWDESWTPMCWYINVESPHRRTALGYDTCDDQLDVVVSVDRTEWRWKDEDHLDAGVRTGIYTPLEAAAIRNTGERAIAIVQRDTPPFSRDWLEWRPDPSWRVPSLPDGWDEEPTGRLGFRLPPMEPCPFCRNIAGFVSPTAGPPAVVWEDELSYAFLAPVAHGGVDGHTLVIPRRHVETILDLRTDEEAALAITVGRVARAVRAAFDPDGIVVVQRNGIAAEQTVPHVHHHVIPRDVDTPYPPREWLPRIPIERRSEVAERLRSFI